MTNNENPENIIQDNPVKLTYDNEVNAHKSRDAILWTVATFFLFNIGLLAFNSQSIANFASTLDVNPKTEKFKQITNEYVALTEKYGLTGPRELIDKLKDLAKGDN